MTSLTGRQDSWRRSSEEIFYPTIDRGLQLLRGFIERPRQVCLTFIDAGLKLTLSLQEFDQALNVRAAERSSRSRSACVSHTQRRSELAHAQLCLMTVEANLHICAKLTDAVLVGSLYGWRLCLASFGRLQWTIVSK